MLAHGHDRWCWSWPRRTLNRMVLSADTCTALDWIRHDFDRILVAVPPEGSTCRSTAPIYLTSRMNCADLLDRAPSITASTR